MSARVHLQATIRDWKGVSAFTPSSSFVIRRLCRLIDFSRAHLVVEYGPGSGVVTRPLLEQLRTDARLIAIELNDKFAQHLTQSVDDPRLKIFHDSAERVAEILEMAGAASADYIVSGIPFFWTPEDVREAIIEASWKVLRPGGRFVALQMFHVPRRYLHAHLKKRFGNVSSQIEFFNIPPLRVLEAVKTPR